MLSAKDFANNPVLSLDTETYGVRREDSPFSFQISNGVVSEYYDFRTDDLTDILPIFGQERLWVMFNSSFDMQKMAMKGITLKGEVLDLKELSRIHYSNFPKLSLDAALKKFLDKSKNSEVKQYIKDNKLECYADVPVEIMSRYGKDDAFQTFELWEYLSLKVDKELIDRSKRMAAICHEMGERGFTLDIENVFKFEEIYKNKLEAVDEEITSQAGEPYKNGPIWLRDFFDIHGVQYEVKAETGNPKFGKKFLKKMTHPVAKLVMERRHYHHYVSSFFKNLVAFGMHGTLHSSPDSAGAETGRFSYRSPNIMNIPKRTVNVGGVDVNLKKCFIPRKGYKIASIDYDQQEFRLLLDFAGEQRLINEVLNGKDVHQATADLVNITRDAAKALNFGLIYGVGHTEMSNMLDITPYKAKELKNTVLSAMPYVNRFIYYVRSQAIKNGFIRNIYGRRLYLSSDDFAYAMVNYLIQGSGADIIKKSMIEVSDYIADKDIFILVTMHDELVFEFRDGLDEHIQKIATIMENIYKPRCGMYLTTSYHISDKSWGDCK